MSETPTTLSKEIQIAWICIGLICLIRLLTLGFPGLVDPSDARYAVMAEHMAQGSDWISLKAFERGQLVPYWSKPPLAFWLAVISIKLFGASVWALRLPTFLASLATALLIVRIGRQFFSANVGLLAAAFFLSSGFIFTFSGTVLLDPLLTFFITAAVGELLLLFSNTSTHTTPGNVHRYITAAFFCGFGFLTKGPIAIIFPAMIGFGFVVLYKQYRMLVSPVLLPALVVTLSIISPWLYLHEQANPGFLHYFLLEENFNRFASHTDKLINGTLHASFRGASIVYFLVALLPWGLLGMCTWRWNLSQVKNSKILSALVVWALLPVLFLAAGKQVLIYYVMPFVPPFMLLLAYAYYQYADNHPVVLRRAVRLNAAIVVLVMVASLVLVLQAHRISGASMKFELSVFVVLICLMGGIATRLRQAALVRQSLLLTVLMAFAFGALTICSATQVESKKSTKLLFEFLAEKHLLPSPSLSFFAEVPDSAYHYFYKQYSDRPISSGDIHLLEDGSSALNITGPNVVISRDKNSDRASIYLGQNPQYTVGKWRIYVVQNPAK